MVAIQTLSFVGMYFMRSERGTVTIRMGTYATDNLTELPVRLVFVPLEFGREIDIGADPVVV